MAPYTIDQLRDPQTYTTDDELRQFAVTLAGSIRQIIHEEHGFGADAIALVLSGQYAERVHKSWMRRIEKTGAQANEQAAATREAARVLDTITPPSGVAIALDGVHIALTIPRDGGIMTPKIKRLGGYWDIDRARFILPLDAARSLPRVLTNWQREYDKQTAERRAAAADRERRLREQEDREEEQGRRAYENYLRRQEAAEAAAEKRRANRVKVVAGRYNVGDDYHGRTITGFGRSWTATEKRVPEKHWHGSLYEPCPICGQEPVEVDTGVCEEHHPHAVSVTTEYCYAYFE